MPSETDSLVPNVTGGFMPIIDDGLVPNTADGLIDRVAGGTVSSVADGLVVRLWKQTLDGELHQRISFRHELETSYMFCVLHNCGVDT